MLPLQVWNLKMYGYATPAGSHAAQARTKRIRKWTHGQERNRVITPKEGTRQQLAAEVTESDAYHPGYKVHCA